MDEFDHSAYTDAFWTHALTPKRVGVLAKPDGSGKGSSDCGDEMEFQLRIKDDVITNCVFLAEGCAQNVACGDALAQLCLGKKTGEALALKPEDVSKALGGLPDSHMHCAQLAIKVLQEALLDYLKNKETPWKKLYS